MNRQTIVPIAEAPRLSDAERAVSLGGVMANRRAAMQFAPHEHLYFQGDGPTGVYQIVSGTVILYRLTADGRRQIQDFASAGDLLALTFADEHDLSAEALTEVEAHFVPRAAFDRALQEDAHFRHAIFTLIGDMLHAAREQAMLLGLKSAMERTASFLIFLEGRFHDPAGGYTPIRMSRCDIADYLGLTLETVSRMLNRLKQQGVIDLPRPDLFRVLDRTRLLALSGEHDADTSRSAARM